MSDIAVVTGAEGFIGSHLVEKLVGRGCRVRAMVLYNMFGSAGWLDALDPEITGQVDVVFGDVRDPATVHQVVDGAAMVYHLAAIGSVRYSYSAPRSFVDTNTIGTLHVLGGCARLPDPASGAHLDQQDLRDRAHGPDYRGASPHSAEPDLAVRRAADLTSRERQCLMMLVDGLDTVAITRHLAVSRTTARTHLQSVLTKLGVHSRLEAVSFAVRYRLPDMWREASLPAAPELAWPAQPPWQQHAAESGRRVAAGLAARFLRRGTTTTAGRLGRPARAWQA